MSDASAKYAEQLLDVVNDAARAVGSRFVTFLTVGVYIAITVASTTDEMLVRGSLVTLPLLNAQIPIAGFFGFYTVAPWLLLFLHCDVLLQMSTLSRKLALFRNAAEGIPEQERARLRERLANFYYVQFLTGEGPSLLLHRLSGLILWLAVIAFPFALMVGTQVRFLPYHSEAVTWLHRLALIADVALVLMMWPRLSPRAPRRGLRAGKLALPPLLLAVCLAAVGVALFVATIPDERTGTGQWFKVRNLRLQGQVLTANNLPPEVVNMLRDGSPEQREKQLLLVSPLKSLQGRDLRHADFFNAVLPRLDLRALRDDYGLHVTDLRGADLRWSQMQGVLLNEAMLDDASLEGAQLQGASLEATRLMRANLRQAQLQNARFTNADAARAQLDGARLQGADLSGASFEGASLAAAELQGALLRSANLRHANLSGAGLQGADLSGARLDGAKLRGANLRGARLRGASVVGADFEAAEVDLTDVEGLQPTGKELRDLFVKAHVGRCLDQQAPLLGRCTEAAGDRYRQLLTDALAELACTSPYFTRGMALRLGDPEQQQLAAQVITSTLNGRGCEGGKLLPEEVRERAGQLAANPPES